MISAGPVLAIGIVVFAASFLGVAAVRAIATRRQWLDYPNSRSSHTIATPRAGGLAIVVVSEAASVILLSRHRLLTHDWTIVLVTAIIVAAVSWIDDLRPLSNKFRFSVHVGVAVVVLATFGTIGGAELPSIGTISLRAAGTVLALLWIVGLTNAYNFMDGIDLMAAGQAIAAGAGWAVLGKIVKAPDLVLVGSVVSIAAAAFAIHNRPPARIFMGDVGSAFLGYLLATLAVLGVHRDPLLAISGAVLVWPFVFDTTFTFLRRLRNREVVFKAHRSHLYQRLVIAGMTHMQVSLLYFTLDLIGIGCAVALMMGVPYAPVFSTIAITASASGLWVFVTQTEQRARAARA